MSAQVAGRPVVRADQVTLGVLVSEVPRDAVDDAVTVCGVRENKVGWQAARACGCVSDVGVVPVTGDAVDDLLAGALAVQAAGVAVRCTRVLGD
jgi:hypothetical protein